MNSQANNTHSFHVQLQQQILTVHAFLVSMNALCKEFTQGLAPEFSPVDLQREVRSYSHETLITLTRSANSFSVFFEEYTADSGGHSYGTISRYTFWLEHSGKRLIQMTNSGNWLNFDVTMPDADRFAERALQEFSGKL